MSYLRNVRESFWFLPAMLCLGAAVLAQSLVALDRVVGPPQTQLLDIIIYRAGPDGSRDVLGSIAGSMLAVASTTFSITIAVLVLTSSSYGPRLVRNFMADRGNQFVLGAYLATYLYSLLVLRSIRTIGDLDSGDTFVPQYAVNVAVLLALLCIGVLVWFIHHISDSIQVWTLSHRVLGELRATVDAMYPDSMGQGQPDPDDRLKDEALSGHPVARVRARSAGYVLSVDTERLMHLATENDLVLDMTVRPGSYCVEGAPMLDVRARGPVEEKLTTALRRCLSLGEARSPVQDVEFATQQLVEMAVRALSPGTNDPYTAVNALDDVSDGLAALSRRRIPSPVRLDEAGKVRVVAPSVTLERLVDLVVDAIRTYGLDHPPVVVRTLDVLARIGADAQPAVREHLVRSADLLVRHYASTDPLTHDLDLVTEHAEQVRAQIRQARVSG